MKTYEVMNWAQTAVTEIAQMEVEDFKQSGECSSDEITAYLVSLDTKRTYFLIDMLADHLYDDVECMVDLIGDHIYGAVNKLEILDGLSAYGKTMADVAVQLKARL